MLVRPLISRSFTLEFNPLTADEITKTVQSVASKESLELSEKAIHLIVRRSNGHARDAISLLEMFKIVGEESFLSSIVLADRLFMDLMKASVEGNRPVIKSTIEKASLIPLTILNADMERFMKKLMDVILIEGKTILGVVDKQLILKVFGLHRLS